MMDLKEIIKWFIPCFHLLLIKKVKMFGYLTHICLFLLFFARPSCGAKVDTENSLASDEDAKNIVNFNYFDVDSKYNNQSDVVGDTFKENEARFFPDTSVGRTFGRPLKKLAAALIPLAFQIGAASTWAVVAALVGVKTLMVALVILKLLLVAGAAKIGALFGQKTHETHGWEPPHQKEIHLHIHNGHQPGHEEQIPISTWSRDGTVPAAVASDTKNINLVLNPYAAAIAGPQTISTPYGNYVKIGSPQTQIQ